MNWEDGSGRHKFPFPIEIKINQIKNEIFVCKNTIKKSLNELMEYGLIEKVDWVKPRHSACFMVLVHSDALIDRFDDATGKIIFTDTLSFNFSKE